MIIYAHQNILFSFVPNKHPGQLINLSQNVLIMMNTVNTKFSYIEVWFTNQNSNALEIEDNDTNYWVDIFVIESNV